MGLQYRASGQGSRFSLKWAAIPHDLPCIVTAIFNNQAQKHGPVLPYIHPRLQQVRVYTTKGAKAVWNSGDDDESCKKSAYGFIRLVLLTLLAPSENVPCSSMNLKSVLILICTDINMKINSTAGSCFRQHHHIIVAIISIKIVLSFTCPKWQVDPSIMDTRSVNERNRRGIQL